MLRDLCHKIAYLPVVDEPSTDSRNDAVSKFGGLPYLSGPDDWPKCQECGQRMTIMVQIDMSKIPDRQENSLFQMFVCLPTDGRDCGISGVGRMIPLLSDGALPSSFCSTEGPKKDEHLILEWTRTDDFPTSYEIKEVAKKNGIEAESSDEIEELVDSSNYGEKLFGCPTWIQGSSLGQDEELIVQLSSDGILEFSYGDSGYLYCVRNTKTNELEILMDMD